MGNHHRGNCSYYQSTKPVDRCCSCDGFAVTDFTDVEPSDRTWTKLKSCHKKQTHNKGNILILRMGLALDKKENCLRRVGTHKERSAAEILEQRDSHHCCRKIYEIGQCYRLVCAKIGSLFEYNRRIENNCIYSAKLLKCLKWHRNQNSSLGVRYRKYLWPSFWASSTRRSHINFTNSHSNLILRVHPAHKRL